MMEDTVKRGDIFYADLSPVVGSEQGGTRPVLIIQNDTGNRHSPTVIAAAITSQTGKARLPTHIDIAGGSVGKDGKPLDVGMDIFHRGLCLPSDNKMTAEDQKVIIEVIRRCFE